jgi:hypothetical protein
MVSGICVVAGVLVRVLWPTFPTQLVIQLIDREVEQVSICTHDSLRDFGTVCGFLPPFDPFVFHLVVQFGVHVLFAFFDEQCNCQDVAVGGNMSRAAASFTHNVWEVGAAVLVWADVPSTGSRGAPESPSTLDVSLDAVLLRALIPGGG